MILIWCCCLLYGVVVNCFGIVVCCLGGVVCCFVGVVCCFGVAMCCSLDGVVCCFCAVIVVVYTVKSVLQILTLTGQYIDQSVSRCVPTSVVLPKLLAYWFHSFSSCLQSILMQLALSGAPELTKDTVRCMHKAFPDPKPIMDRLFAVSGYTHCTG